MSASGSAGSAQEIVAGAAAHLSGALDLAATLQGIAAAARSALGADRATCYVQDAGQIVSAVHTTETDPERRAFLEGALGLETAELPILRLQHAQADPLLVVEDVRRHPAISPRLAARLGSGAFLSVRLEHASVQADDAPALLGTLFCNYSKPKRFTAADRSAAQGLANLAVLALANARLQAATAQGLEENRALATEQAALRRLATLVAAEADPEAVFAQAAEEVAGLLGVDCGVVVRFSDSEHGEVVGVWGAEGSPSLGIGTLVPLSGESATARVFRSGQPARMRDYAGLDEETGKLLVTTPYRSGVAAPIRVGPRMWGAIGAVTSRPELLSDGCEQRLGSFGELVGVAIANAEARARLAAQAASDPLTGLANHRTFFERLHAEAERARRHGHPLSLVIIDLDHFKHVNDTHGHPVGDRVLVEVAERLSALARAEDTLARVGGEEFAWLLPESGAHAAWAAAERARRAIGCAPFPQVGTLTMSGGVAELATGASVNQLFHAADAALYWAKAQGRDACVPYAPEHEKALAARPSGAAARLAPSVERLLALAREQLGVALVAVGQFQGGKEVWRYLDGDGAAFGMRPGGEIPLEETYCQRVVQGRLPNLIRDARREERVHDLAVTQEAGIGAYAGVPITLPGGDLYGMLCCLSPRPEPGLGERDVRLLRVLAGMLGEELEREEHDTAVRRDQSERIRRVLGGEGLSVVLQPIVELAGGRVVAAEALSRFAAEPRRACLVRRGGGRGAGGGARALRNPGRPGAPRRAAGGGAPVA